MIQLLKRRSQKKRGPVTKQEPVKETVAKGSPTFPVKLESQFGAADDLCKKPTERALPPLTPVSIAEILSDIMADIAPLANEACIQVFADAGPHRAQRIDRRVAISILSDLSMTALENLLDNQRGELAFTVHANANAVEIDLRFGGSALSQTALHRLFPEHGPDMRPFHIQQTNPRPATLARQSGGDLQLLQSDENGTRLRLTLPRIV